MIRIKDYIFNENEIEFIEKIENGLIVCPKAVNVNVKEIKNATFEDIEWNYENNNEYCNVFYEDRIKELEEKNKTFEDYNKDLNKQLDKLQQRIDKAIEYIGSITDVKVRYFNYREFEKQGLHISNEELRKRVKEQKLEGLYIEIDRDDILKILKGEVNE